KRPKLSLNTTQLPKSLGKSNTALRIETLSVASPTSRNTFQNAFGPLDTQPQSARPLPNRIDTSTPLRASSSDSVISSASSTSTSSSEASATSASSTDSLTPPVPYRLPYNNKSILTNGPLPRGRSRKSYTTAMPIFSTPKKVSFKAPLTEEIHTVKYTMAHIDIESSSSSISTLNLPPPSLLLRGQSKTPALSTKPDESSDRQAKQDESNNRLEPKAKTPSVGDKRESSDEDDSDTCPSTPVTRRNPKRRREWVWTLAPLKTQSSDDIATSE
ncbi:hypothetical protein BDV97DRAFT_275906, partial [Delphinella strobiligena]